MPHRTVAHWWPPAVAALLLCLLPPAGASAGDVRADADIAGIVDRSCGGCHRPGAPAAAHPADRVVPGFAEASPLFRILISRHHGEASPSDWPTAAEIETVRAYIDGRAGEASAEASWGSTLSLETDRSRYRPGDTIEIRVKTGTECHLTLISIDPRGDAVVLVPNDMERETRLVPGTVRIVPAPGAAYVLKARKEGSERFVAWCTAEPGPLAGIRYAFGSQRFRLLGPWPEALEELIEASVAMASENRKGRSGRRPAADGPSLFGPHAYAAHRVTTADDQAAASIARSRAANASQPPATIAPTASTDPTASVDRPVTP